MSDDTQRSVLELLTDKGQSAKQLARLLKEEGLKKKQINSSLYKMLGAGDLVQKIEGTPPLWIRIGDAPEQEEEELEGPRLFHVFIDGDNSPCLEEALPYGDSCALWCTVSSMYANFEPELDDPAFFKRMKTSEKGVSAAQLMMSMTRVCEEHADGSLPYESMIFVIVSKNKFFSAMGAALEEEYSFLEVQIVDNSWEGLREWLE